MVFYVRSKNATLHSQEVENINYASARGTDVKAVMREMISEPIGYEYRVCVRTQTASVRKKKMGARPSSNTNYYMSWRPLPIAQGIEGGWTAAGP